MESESGTTNTKISDSGYSISCSNSNSQRSASSKSRHSGSNSSRSSGYCGAPTVDGSADNGPPPPIKRNKEKDHKKKKLKSTSASSPAVTQTANSTSVENGSVTVLKDTINDSKTGSEPKPVESAKPNGTVKDAQSTSQQELEAGEELLLMTAETDCVDETMGRNVHIEAANEAHADEEIYDDINAMELNQSDTSDGQLEADASIANQPDDGFSCIISMYDGVVLYTTTNLTSVLGFPRNMWLGRSFIDFVHPKDRDTFSSQITSDIALPLVESNGKKKDIKNTLYVCLRKYRGLRTSGYGVIEKSVSYKAFQLTVTFRNISDSKAKMLDNNAGMFLVIVAAPVSSSYKVPDETKKSAKFGMRHTAACVFSHVDPDVVTNFGFLPQDMLGKSVFDFYHPEDMPFLKEIYESVLRMCQTAGSVFRSKPYRFAVHNGGFAMIETEWSRFVNPWSRRLEFVIGLHRVLQGPHNPNIFDPPTDNIAEQISEEVLKESRIIQDEIVILLNKELSRPTEATKHVVSKRCKDLATFMETLMNEVSTSNLQLDLPQDADPTFSERDSVMLGEISPHHDYCDSKSSSEIPPSYNQLNYNENIQRFFQSKPTTAAAPSDGGTTGVQSVATATTTDVDQEILGQGKSLSHGNNQKCLSPTQNSGVSGSGSAGNLSSGSNPNLECATNTTAGTNTSNDAYTLPHLTEALLFKHNEDMEKMMVQKHREQRTSIKADRENKKSQHKNEKKLTEKNVERIEQMMSYHTHGVKRSGSHSWEGDSHKVSKHKHQITAAQIAEIRKSSETNNSSQVQHDSRYPAENVYASGLNDANLWPPFSVSMTSMKNTQGNATVPVPHTTGDPTPDLNVQSMLHNYNTMFPAVPIFCSSLPWVSVPMARVQQAIGPEFVTETSNDGCVNCSGNEEKSSPSGSSQLKRPASLAISMKALDSTVSINATNKKMSTLYDNLESGTTAAAGSTITNEAFTLSHLTEALLTKHNEDVDMITLQQQRDQRANIKSQYKNARRNAENGGLEQQMSCHNHGVKRSGSHNWEDDSHKISKHRHQMVPTQIAEIRNTSERTPGNMCTSNLDDANLWPPFSVSNNSQSNTTTSVPSGNFSSGMFPVYCMPPQQRHAAEGAFQVHYVPGMMYNYNTIFPAAPIICSPLPMVPVPMVQSQQMIAPELVPAPTCNGNEQKTCGSQFQRRASQATSVKAEPGSAIGSIASASVVTKATNMETSEALADQCKYRDVSTTDEESSLSSFYSSFLITDTGSGSNDGSLNAEAQTNSSEENAWKTRNYPPRKRDPHWLQTVSVTPELIYRYQMTARSIEDILAADLHNLKEITQPMMVNDQLNQLYIEMELEGLSTKLTLEEGITSSSSGEDSSPREFKPKRKRRSYSSLLMIYEENTPFPSPGN